MSKRLSGAALFVAAAVVPSTQAAAAKLTVLTSFNGTNGRFPTGGLLADSAGNLYGTASGGGASDGGTVFKLTPPAAGQTAWTNTVLTVFTCTTGASPSCPAGNRPYGSLIADRAGNLYGTTSRGGTYSSGAVFELTPPAAGQTAWNETVLLSFDQYDGELPEGGLIADSAGNLYGTTAEGGPMDGGTVFKLAPPAAGQTAWTETVLTDFNFTDGDFPTGNLIADSTGNLYGTTSGGGPSRDGVVFELSPPSAGQTVWTETVLATFTGKNGSTPDGGLIADSAGNLYGTTELGGTTEKGQTSKNGIAFELTPPAAGQTAWTETVLISFGKANGETPYGSLVADSAGNLYGTSANGGALQDGTVFELTPPAAGQTAWSATVLARFDGANGQSPLGGLIAGSAGKLYGTADLGGADNFGVVFELKR
jgi:uncharacterized repeat protein (TIGR03803 family)